MSIITKPRIVAVIGTRDLVVYQNSKNLLYLKLLCEKYRNEGYELATGCADGTDYLAMRIWGLTQSKGHIYLPWAEYNKEYQKEYPHYEYIVYDDSKIEWTRSVFMYHPSASTLTSGSFNLHARNYGIIQNANLVIALPNMTPSKGGTAQGMRVARALGIPLIDLSDMGDLNYVKYIL